MKYDNNNPVPARSDAALRLIAGVLFVAVCAMGIGLVSIINFVTGGGIGQLLAGVFVNNNTNVTWFITRSSGIIAYLLLWLSTIWGLAVSYKTFDPILERIFSFDLHEYLSLLAIGFTAIHLIVLLFDQFEPFTLPQLLVPFISDYRPLWIGAGVIALYAMVAVTVTFYIRKRIGYRSFQLIHYFSYAAFALVLLHSLFAGTDSKLLITQVMYAVTGLSVVFLSTFHVALRLLERGSKTPGRRADNPRGDTNFARNTH